MIGLILLFLQKTILVAVVIVGMIAVFQELKNILKMGFGNSYKSK